MKLSIVMATYNGEKYIVEQMDSLRTQTRTADEVLIFDDRSTDGTVKIIEDYIEKYDLNSWQLKVNEQNKGFRKNFVDSLMQATGDLIFPCDQDDIWMPEKLAEMETIMEAHPEIGLLLSSFIEFYENGKRNKVVGANDGMLVHEQIRACVFNGREHGCASCVRRPLTTWYTEYWEADFSHDILLWMLSGISDSLYYYGKPLIHHRIYAASSSTAENARFRRSNVRCERIERTRRYTLCMMRFLGNEQCTRVEEKKKTLTNYLAFLDRRALLAKTRRITAALRLLGDLKYYNTFRQYLGDIYCFVLPEWLQKSLRRFV